MKILDKINLVIFSLIILIESLIMCVLSFGWLRVDIILNGIKFLVINPIANRVALAVAIILLLMSIKSIFFNSYSKKSSKNREGILLENDNGKLLVSKDTIESLTDTVVKSFESAESVMTKVDIDDESNIKIYITLFVYPDAIIKELSNKLQANVKETIKASLDLDIKEVNIRIKNVSVKKETNIKE